ncbi:MAG: DUF1631 family protein [Betaproteobacteria bacterium]
MSTPTFTAKTNTLLSAVRDRLAEHFAHAVVAQALPVADLIEAQADQATAKERRDVLRAASSTLAALHAPLGSGLVNSVCRQFDSKLKPESFSKLGTLTLDTLALVDEAQMQEEIAIGKAATRLKEQVNFESFSLTRRIGHLIGIEHIVDRDNPVFPGIFAQALMDALVQCNCAAPQRVVIFDAFGPMLIEILPGAYQAANAYLIEQGVLIEIKENYGRAILGKSMEAQGNPAPVPTSGNAPPSGPPPQVDTSVVTAPRTVAKPEDALGTLLRQVLRRENAPDERSGAVQRALAVAHAGGTQAASANTATDAQWNAMGLLQGNLRAQMQAALQAQAGFFTASVTPAAAAADNADEPGAPPSPFTPAFTASLDVAQLVAAGIVVGAFNRLLASPPIREHVGELLLQLQMPAIRATFAEPALLTDDRHVVRRTIDRLTEFAIAQPELMQPGTSSHESLSLILGELAAQEKYDAATFATVADKIDALFAYHEETAAENDPKAQMLIEIELMESAINSASYAIESRLNGGSTSVDDPEYLCTFARAVWKEVLFSDMLNGGAQGDLWRRDIETLELLLRTVRPQDTKAEQAELTRRLPDLHSRLDEGAKSVHADPAYFAEFMTQLHATHSFSLTGALWRPAGQTPRKPAIDLAATQQLKITGQFTALPHLMRGHWIEFIDDVAGELEGRARRARLNWMSPIGAVCLFKDYLADETFTIDLKDLDEQIRGKRASLVASLGISAHAIDYAIRNLGVTAGSAEA